MQCSLLHFVIEINSLLRNAVVKTDVIRQMHFVNQYSLPYPIVRNPIEPRLIHLVAKAVHVTAAILQ